MGTEPGPAQLRGRGQDPARGLHRRRGCGGRWPGAGSAGWRALGRLRTRSSRGINTALALRAAGTSTRSSPAGTRTLSCGEDTGTSVPPRSLSHGHRPHAGQQPAVPCVPHSPPRGSRQPRTHSRPGAGGRQSSPGWQGHIWLMLKARPPGGTWQLWPSSSRRWHSHSPCCRAQQPPVPHSSSRWHRAPGGAERGVRGRGDTDRDGAGCPQHLLALHHRSHRCHRGHPLPRPITSQSPRVEAQVCPLCVCPLPSPPQSPAHPPARRARAAGTSRRGRGGPGRSGGPGGRSGRRGVGAGTARSARHRSARGRRGDPSCPVCTVSPAQGAGHTCQGTIPNPGASSLTPSSLTPGQARSSGMGQNLSVCPYAAERGSPWWNPHPSWNPVLFFFSSGKQNPAWGSVPRGGRAAGGGSAQKSCCSR